MKKSILLITIILLAIQAYTQIHLQRLLYNPTISKEQTLKNRVIKEDTLLLPFFDDFSKNTHYPDSNLWFDNYVFVNNNFGKNPISIGVATFDILDEKGNLYNYASESPFIADYLTSKPINLAYNKTLNNFSISSTELYYYQTSTQTFYGADSLFYYSGNFLLNCKYHPTTYTTSMTIYFSSTQLIDVSDSLYYYDINLQQYVPIQRYIFDYYSPSDSIYLSFYYQPQGYGGNAPESTDSLVLEFKVPGKNWTHIWSTKGEAFSDFKPIFIPITDTTWLKKGFQFRFYNYASTGSYLYPSLVSNVDYWNLDYIYINRNRNYNDTIYPDVAVQQSQFSFIKPPYLSIPWEHYKQQSGLQIDSLQFQYKNLSDTILNIIRFITVKDYINNQLIRKDSLGSDNLYPFASENFKMKNTQNYMPTNSNEKAIFEIKYSVSAPSLLSQSMFTYNDTCRILQIFDNYYAADDGTAEYGIGLSGNGTQNGKFAMLFKPLVGDTLRGVYMYFNRSLNNSNQRYFYLTIWNSDSSYNPTNIILQKQGYRPEFDGYEQFHYYSLDTAIYIDKPFFIGWTQTTTDFLNLGFDLNRDYSSNVKYNISGQWLQIPYNGTPMIRPVFSKNPVVAIPIISNNTDTIILYPNPANEFIYINSNTPVFYKIYNIYGQLIDSGFASCIPTYSIPNGYYLVKIINKHNIHTFKIIINHSW